ncbi:aspartate carbamoyltransferase [Vibrio alginolyticus]
MLGNLSEDYEMTTLIADVKTRFALAKRLRLRGVIFVNSIEF